MRILALAAAVAVATTLASAPNALACGEDRDDVSPVIVQPVSLLEQAARMDVEATSFERSAAAVRRQARVLDARAARMRTEAAGAPWRTRGQLLAQAADLEARAEQIRADAMSREQRAATLRAEANALRIRARGGRPGWRGAATVSF